MDFKSVFNTVPGNSVLLQPDAPRFTIESVTDGYLKATGRTRDELLGKGLFEVFPGSPEDFNDVSEKTVRASLEYALAHKEPHYLPLQRYDIPAGEGSFTERYWKANNKPVLDEAGKVIYLIHTADDVTAQVQAEQTQARMGNIERAYNLFMQAPVIIGIVTGKEYRIELANDAILQLWGKTPDIVGKPLLEALPEIRDQGFIGLLDGVREKGVPFQANETPATFIRNGKPEVRYLDFIYHPYYEDRKEETATGVFAVAHDVTEQVEVRQKFRNVIEQAGAPILILKGEDLVLDVANQALFDLWQVGPEAIGKTFLEILPEMKDQMFVELLHKVRQTGEPFYGKQVPAFFRRKGGVEETVYFNFSYEPYREADGRITGVLVLATDVTEQVLVNQKIGRSEEELKRFKFMADHAQDPFILMQEDGTFAYLNKKAMDAWGYTEEEARTIRVPDVDPIYHDQMFSEAFARAQKEEIPQFETLHKRKDGHIYPVEVNMGGLTLGGKPYLFAVARDITERKKTEQELKQSKERFELVSKATRDAIWDWNLVTNEIWWNEGFRTLFGYREEEIEPGVESWYNRLHPDDLDRVTRAIHRVIDHGGTQWADEYRFRKSDGSYAIVLDRGYAIHDENGKPLRMLGSMQDITERKKTEELLVQKDRNFRSMIDHAPVAMIVFRGADMILETVNQEMLELLNKTSAIIGKPLLEALPEIKGHSIYDILYGVFRSGEPYYGNEWLVPLEHNGVMEDRYFNFAFTPVEENNEITGIMEVATEVTGQVLARRRIEEQNRELQFVMNVMPQLVWHTQPDGWADFFNQVFQDYTGLPTERLSGHQWAELLHPDDREISIRVWQQALSGERQSYVIEHRLLGKDGQYRWFLTRGVALKNEQGQVVRWYGTTTDIQHQKTATEILEQRVQERTRDLQEANNELRNLNTDLEQFTYVSHHDLQEPLRKIIMFSDMVKSDSYDSLSEASQRRLDRVNESARRMSGALRDVLNFASLNKAEQFQTVDLDEVLAAVEMDLELVFTEKGATLNRDNLPTIKAVPQQMHQLFYNLVNNALKFSKPGEPPVITITCKRPGEEEIRKHAELGTGKLYYELAVKDNGIGFSPENAEKIFQMFQRLHNRDAYAGTGIGLALARKVVLNHDGKIWAESRPGEGATFHIVLPAS